MIETNHNEAIVLGKNVSIGAGSVLNSCNEGEVSKLNCPSLIFIGEGTYVGEMNNIRASGSQIRIGKKCLISQQVNIIGTNHLIDKNTFMMDQPWDYSRKGVNIGDDVWIGCGATILPGITIGNGAIIGAGSVVTKNVKPYSIVVGNPARHLRYRE